jgi:serine/threonine protein kinase
MALVIKIKNSSGKESTISNIRKLSSGFEGVTYKATMDGEPIILKQLTNFKTAIQGNQLDNQLKVEVKLMKSVGTCDNPSLGITCFKGIIAPEMNIAYFREHIPDIVPLSYTYVNEEEKDRFFLMYNLLEGKELLDYIIKQSLSKEQKVSIIYQLLTILSTLHTHDIFHADIKPENLYYNISSDKLTSLDYGFSCNATDRKSCNFENHRRGSPNYLAPEAYQSTFTAALLPMDIFAAGITIYGIITSGEFITVEKDPTKSFRDLKREFLRIDWGRYYVKQKGFTDDMYDFFLSMIQEDPSKRPTASQSKDKFEKLVGENKVLIGAAASAGASASGGNESAAGGAGAKAPVAKAAEGGRRTRRKKSKKNRKSRSRR